MNTRTCPSSREIQKMLIGDVSDKRLGEISDHLESCEACLRVADHISSSRQDCLFTPGPFPVDEHDQTIQYVIRQGQAIFGQNLEPLTDTLERGLDKTQPIPMTSDYVPDDLKAILNPSKLPDEIGRLGNCRILGFIGRGGMGAVFRGEDLSLDRPVAVKVLFSGRPVDASMKRRFIREAKAMAAIDHENVVSIFSVDETADPPFLTMPLLSGEVLAQGLAAGRTFADEEVARIGKELASALEAAHHRGVIHRDVKPGNIWLEPSGRVKLLDFGLAHADDLELTSTGQVLGTPRYMSPEQTLGKPAQERSDLFSLGCVLYQLVTGKPPFGGDSLAAVFRSIGDGNYERLDASKPEIDADLAGVVNRLLEVEPHNRYSSATELKEKLTETELRLTQSGQPANRTIPSAAPSSELSPQGFQLPRWSFIIALLLVVGTLGGLAISGVFNDSQVAPTSQREVAQWVIDSGGFVSLQNGNVEIREEEQLPTPLGSIYAVYLSRLDEITDGDLEMLVHLNEGCSIYLQGLGIDGSGLQHIAKIAQLEGVNLDDCQNIDPRNLRHLRDQSELTYLSACGTNLGDELAELATTLPKLSSLALGSQVTADVVPLIAKCTGLRELNLVSSDLDAEVLAFLQEFKELRQLTFHTDQLSRDLVSLLNRCPNIKQVRFYFGKPSLDTLNQLRHVEMLDLSYSDLSDTDLSLLRSLSSLDELILRDCDLGSETQQSLPGKMPNCKISF